MRLAIVGSRYISDRQVLLDALKLVPSLESVTEIVSGGAKGVDKLAEEFAKENNLKLTVFRPNYSLYGRGATLMRNTEIIEYADAVLAIPVRGGSNGTHDDIRKARKMGKRLFIHEVAAPTTQPSTEKKDLKMKPAENPYKAGDAVTHTAFGKGFVTGVDGNFVTVNFETAGEKRIFCTFKGMSLD